MAVEVPESKTQTGKVMAVSVNVASTKEEYLKEKAKVELISDISIKKLLRFWCHITEEPKLWDKYKEKEIFEVIFHLQNFQIAKKNSHLVHWAPCLLAGLEFIYALTLLGEERPNDAGPRDQRQVQIL